MEKEKKKRTAQRAAFTKALTAFNETRRSVAEKIKLQLAFKVLEDAMNDLTITSNNVLDFIYDTVEEGSPVILSEMAQVDEYKKKYFEAKILFEESQSSKNSTRVEQENRAGVSSDTKRSYKLPKIELIKFSGDVREWLHFWSLFKKIHEDTNIAEEDKFQYLIQAMVPNSHAEMLVRSFPPTAENYDKAITSLKNRFGRDELQIEVYVRDLLQLVLQNAVTPSKNIVLSSLYDKLESHLRSLDSLGVTTEKCAAMLFPLVESSLPEELLRTWQRSMGQNNSTACATSGESSTQSKDRLSQLIKFLEGEVQNEVRISMAVKGFELKSPGDSDKTKKDKSRNNKDTPSAASLLAMKRKNKVCVFCDAVEHRSAACEKAKRMTLAERQEIVKKKNCCYSCLNVGHSFRKCRIPLKCDECDRRHVTLMCPGKAEPDSDDKTIANKDLTKNLASFCSDPEVLMQTLKVILYNGDKEMQVRVVIDTGSQRSYVTKDVARKMGYEAVAEQLMTHSLFGGEKSESVTHKKFMVYLASLDKEYACNFAALDQELICEEVPYVKNGVWFNELNELNIKISDVYSDKKQQSVSVLIGADIAGKLLTGKRHILKCGLVAVETLLGWTLMGTVPGIENRHKNIKSTHLFVYNTKIEDLWSLDVLGIKDPIENKSQKERESEVKKQFLSSVKINDEKRYEVLLPWVQNHPVLNNNKSVAVRRLESTVRKLNADGLYDEYNAIFDDWLAEGIIERVPENEKKNWGHYLPHRHVVKENSSTRIRPVFDASAKELHFPSLNDCLEKGPNLIEQIPSILLRFREGKIGIVSDIKKAFLQISIDSKDRDFLRFLWYDKQGNVILLRHCRVVFGVSSSPFMLGAIIDMHLRKIVDSLRNNDELRFSEENIVKLLNSFYVDNCVTSMNSTDQVKSFVMDAKAVMELAGFDLRGWEFSKDNNLDVQTAVLGIIWHKENDTLSLNVPALEQFADLKITKRNILSVTNKIFDPLGFAAPIVLCPRLLLQETWALKLSWDDEVNSETQKKFKRWLHSLTDLDKIEIPRCFLGVDLDFSDLSIHMFSDASKSAYAAVVFLRIQEGSDVRVHFVQAKTRVAPVKQNNSDARASIPRLELLAANIGVRLTASILESLNYKIREVYYWTDSSTVLAWIRRECNWSTFVFNRIKEIRNFSDPKQWNHVPGNMNPADLPSRGCTVKQLVLSKWWEGPDWLRLNPEDWPNNENTLVVDENQINKEVKKTAPKITLHSTVLLTTIRNDSREDDNWYYKRFSKYSKILKVLAWINRFCFNCKNAVTDRKAGNLSVLELKEAETQLIKIIQGETFSDINDARIKHFEPFKDENDIIRIKTKIVLRDDTLDFRCPIILPGDHEIASLIIKEKHENLKHAGVEITMSSLREHFWILGGRKTVRSVVKKCINCTRYDARPLESPPAPLPLDRIRDASVFEVIGVDLAGPIYLKGGQKAWISLFTCAVYRAVHLELVTSLSTASFLMALRRHIGRRGKPGIIYSDNGTNFTGLNNMFKRINLAKLSETLAVEQIEWKFNPPTAAWWGGFWERLIAILKRLLRRTLKRTCLNYEEMLTVLIDCEAVINSRPITFMSESDHETVPLTPSMFLQEIKEIGVIELDEIERVQFDKRYLYRQKVKDALRRRFRNEYLGALVHRINKCQNLREIKVNDVVLIENENLKRLDWPIGRVKNVIVGKDNNVRLVRLITANGELTRPIQRIYPLELKCNILESPENEIVVEKHKSNECKKRQNQNNVSEISYRLNESEKQEQLPVVTKSGRKVMKPERLNYQ